MDTPPFPPPERKQRFYVSEYMRLRAEAEKLLQQAEAVRLKELEAVCEDMRKRIVAWGIEPQMLFPHLVVSKTSKSARDSQRPPGSLQHPPKFAWQGQSWSGAAGPKPKWYLAARAMGITDKQMIDECQRLRDAGKLTHPAWGNGS